MTGIADAYLDRAPMVAITGQAGSDKLHKEAHQVVDIVRMFAAGHEVEHARRAASRRSPRSSARRSASPTLEKPGPTHIELPENLAAMPLEPGDAIRPLEPGRTYFPEPTDEAIAHAARLIADSERPIILAGNGVLRRRRLGRAARLRPRASTSRSR